jgi:hypothetical protein
MTSKTNLPFLGFGLGLRPDHYQDILDTLPPVDWFEIITENFSPYFYVCFLTILLFDRAFRDDQRCAKKYGKFWLSYCQQVPYKIVPFVI